MKKKLILIAVLAALGIAIGSQVHRDIPAAEIEKVYRLPESQFMNLKGMRVHYTDEGKGKSSVVVLIHGTGASLHTWNAWLPKLKKDFRVVRVDLPAFGLTGPSPDRDYSIANYVRFLEAFLAELKIKQINLVGNSLGGQIAWHYATQHGDDVIKLVLIDSAGLPRVGKVPLPIRLARMPVLQTLAKYMSPRFLVKKSLKEVYFDKSKVTDALVDRYFALTLRAGNREAFVDRALQLSDDNGDGLRKLGMPTLIMWGRHDAWIPVSQAELFKKKILLGQLLIYENAGHVPQEEIPDESVAGLLKFLE